MGHSRFKKPVRVAVGLQAPRNIETPLQAYSFLTEHAGDYQTLPHRLARQACLGAIEGGFDAETARAAFVGFARRAGILAPEVDDVVAARAMQSHSGQPLS
ncbi:DUF982 domain-containing protein [Antarcticirhabdus aurantiaca]|uniref:DUF982 domain-containing protein n=1 Tax=Antarcticirhabdus aurantiaca TaxID=2606717 RepID=A0ACD4NJ80_9HYPH|nr:DUF982 domain-containing protein [Jeongeuplla avenae]